MLSLFGRGRIPCLLKRVIVNLTHDKDTAIAGVLFARVGDWLVLKDAQLLAKDRPPVALDGEQIIPCARVAFIQSLGEASQ